MIDQLIRATAANGGIRAVGVITTNLTQSARTRHKLSYLATVALGQSMAGGLLLASNMKAKQSRLTMRIKADGPLGGLIVDAGLDGTVRGYVENPELELPPNQKGLFDVSHGIGKYGYLHIMRDVGYGAPYTSTVELVSGEIGDDIANYLASSEQTPSALVLGVFMGSEGVKSAGGLLIQVLPKAAKDETLVTTLESRIQSLKGFSPLLQAGKTLPQIFTELLGDLNLNILPQVTDLKFKCRCSFNRMMGALKMLGKDELQDMIEKDEGAEAICHFCNEVYRADTSQLQEIITSMNN